MRNKNESMLPTPYPIWVSEATVVRALLRDYEKKILINCNCDENTLGCFVDEKWFIYSLRKDSRICKA